MRKLALATAALGLLVAPAAFAQMPGERDDAQMPRETPGAQSPTDPRQPDARQPDARQPDAGTTARPGTQGEQRGPDQSPYEDETSRSDDPRSQDMAQDTEAKNGEHVVSQGETLSGIAQERLGDAGKWRQIAQLNGIEDPKQLSVGKKLQIPEEGSSQSGTEESGSSGTSDESSFF